MSGLRNHRGILLAAVLLSLLSACTRSEPTGEINAGEWVGTITTEGNVTTVVNESGSVWGGTARLVEEASIGVESGAKEYLLGEIHSIFADETRIYVVDPQVPAVRMYDYGGVFLGNVGAQGQGPGEYVQPNLVTVDSDGRIYVADSRLDRINVYAPEGEPIDTWQVPNYACCYIPMYAIREGLLQVPVRKLERLQPVASLQVYGAEGPIDEERWVPDFNFEPVRKVVGGRRTGVRFTPAFVFAPLPSGGVVAGINDSYRFEFQHPDGRKLIVEHRSERVRVLPEEWEWWRRVSVATTRVFQQMPDYDWDGAEMPNHKPAYDLFVPSMTGEIWVAREGVSEKIPGCAEDPIALGYEVLETDPCWRADWSFDVFGEDGRYLGSVEPLPGTPQHAFQRRVFVRGDLVVATTQDELGTFSVKRYRLVLPGEAMNDES